MEPTLLASFVVMASAAALIGLYSFSSGGMYHPAAPVPSQTNGAPPDSPALTVPPGVRAIQPASDGPRSPGSSASSGPQAYASWPAPSDPTLGTTLGSRPAQPGGGGGIPAATGASKPGGGGGGSSAPAPTPSNTATPSDAATTSDTPSTSGTPTPSDSATETPTPGP